VEHSFDAFPYSCRRPENSHTRLLLVADRRSPLVGTDLVVLDSDGEVEESIF
jgi:hypothetical protein